MHIVLDDSEYSYVASTKVITLAAPYTALSVGQIIRIADLTTGSVFYEASTQRYPISISGADIAHTYDDNNDADADNLQIIIDIGGHTSTPLHGTVLPPEMLHKELRVATTAQQASITPTTGKRLRVYAFQCSMIVTQALTSTLRGTLAFGTDHTTDANKILASCRIKAGDATSCICLTGLNTVGEVNETVTLTNITFSNGAVITRSVVYYSEED